MTETNGNKRVRSLSELSHAVPPPRDLWPAIAAGISTTPAVSGSTKRSPHLRWLAAAAVVAALAVGMWLGRNVLPVGTSQPSQQVASNNTGGVIAASYVTDPKYVKQHAALVRGLEAQLKALPPQTQEKVAASLATIRQSMTDIKAALGRDPGNALLQELLVNTYQDEMRVLNTVHEARDNGQEL